MKFIAWATLLIKASLTLLVEVWYDRNTKVNSTSYEEEVAVSPRLREVHQRVRELYNDRCNYSEEVQAILFASPLEQRLNQREFQLVKLIQTADRADRVLDGMKPASIYSYYHPIKPPEMNRHATTNIT